MRCDTLVICRTRYTARLDNLVTRARASGCRVLFDVDDLIFDNRYVNLVLETLDRQSTEAILDEWFAAMSRLGAMLRLCDGAITTNHFLAKCIEDFAQLPTWVVAQFPQWPAAGALGGDPARQEGIAAAGGGNEHRLFQRDPDAQPRLRARVDSARERDDPARSTYAC